MTSLIARISLFDSFKQSTNQSVGKISEKIDEKENLNFE